jgi:hypothetical protein
VRLQVLSGEHFSICFPRLAYPARSNGCSQRKLFNVTCGTGTGDQSSSTARMSSRSLHNCSGLRARNVCTPLVELDLMAITQPLRCETQ